MNIFANESRYQKNNRYYLNMILKTLWGHNASDKRVQRDDGWNKYFSYTNNIEEADVALLTLQWNYYVDRELLHLAEEEIKFALTHNKKIVAFKDGDEAADVKYPNLILFEVGGNRHLEGLAYHSGIPFFINDYLNTYSDNTMVALKKSAVPTVGFCGVANPPSMRRFYLVIRHYLRMIKYKLGWRKWQPPPFETTSFRWKVLNQFKGSDNIKTNYIIRDQISHHLNIETKQKLIFIKNILDSDYTLCMRGWGNFSVRFYETLCLGRIPIFIDTDCLLPFQDEINYNDLFPWIDGKDLPRAAEIVADFHARLSEDDFIERQMACRKLWLDHMTQDKFERDFAAKISKLKHHQ